MIKTVMILASVLGLAVGCTKKDSTEEPGVIKIGEFAPLTGTDSGFGNSSHNGVKMAIDAINAKGGIGGKKVELITIDNQSRPEESAVAVDRLIRTEQVLAIIGEVTSSRSLAAAPVAQQSKVPMITPSATNARVTAMGDHIFRVCFVDSFQGVVMAKFAIENLKTPRVAILRDRAADYSNGLAEVFASEVKKLGGEVVADLSYQTKDIDFKAQLTQIRSKNPDAVFIPGYYTEAGLIARQARQLGIEVPLLGGDGWDNLKIFDTGREAIKGNYFSTHYSMEKDSPLIQKFTTAYQEKYSEQPDLWAALGYDAANVLLEAIKKSPKLTRSAIRDKIAATSKFEGVTGSITINEDRNAKKSAVVVQVQDGKYKYITTVEP